MSIQICPCAVCTDWKATVRQLEQENLLLRECANSEAVRGNDAEAEVVRLEAEVERLNNALTLAVRHVEVQAQAQVRYAAEMQARLTKMDKKP